MTIYNNKRQDGQQSSEAIVLSCCIAIVNRDYEGKQKQLAESIKKEKLQRDCRGLIHLYLGCKSSWHCNPSWLSLSLKLTVIIFPSMNHGTNAVNSEEEE